jgi:uncharacterized protein DUF3592
MIDFLIIILVGVILIMLSLYFTFQFRIIKKKGVQVDGIIFDLEPSSSGSIRTTYPVVRFLTKEQEWITLTSKIGVVPGVYKKGAKVSIIYEPENPQNFLINSKFTTTVPSIILLIGILVVAIGFILLLDIQF